MLLGSYVIINRTDAYINALGTVAGSGPRIAFVIRFTTTTNPIAISEPSEGHGRSARVGWLRSPCATAWDGHGLGYIVRALRCDAGTGRLIGLTFAHGIVVALT